MMDQKPLAPWVAANALGFGLGFVAVLQAGMLIDFGFDWKMHWRWIEQPPNQGAFEYLSVFVSMLAGGTVVGSAQALSLRSQTIPSRQWILSAVAGFGAIAIAVDWPLIAAGLLGVIPGPVEPIIVVIGGGGATGVVQYAMLRRRGVAAPKWLARWIVRLVAGFVATIAVMLSLEALDTSLPWATDVFVGGLVTAGVAAAMSGRALFDAISRQS